MALRIQDERLTRRVGAGVLVAFVLTVVGVVTIRWPHGGTEITVHFGKASALRVGAPVMVAGQSVGRLARVQLDDHGGIVVLAQIDPAWARRIPINADFFISARSVLAPRYLEIGAPTHHAAPERSLRDGDDVTGTDPPDLDRLVATIWDDLGEVQEFMAAIQPAAARLSASIAKLAPLPPLPPLPDLTVDAPDDLLAHARAFTDRAAEMLATLRADLDAIDVPALKDPHLADAIARAQRAVDAADRLVADARRVFTEATQGDGAIAQLLADTELVDDVKELTKEMKRQPWRVVAHP